MSAAAVLLAIAALTGGDVDLERVASLRPAFEVADWRWEALREGGQESLILLGADGVVHIWTQPRGSAFSAAPRPSVRIAEPRRALVDLRSAASGGRELVVASPAGVELFALGEEGLFVSPSRVGAPRARVLLRTGAPRFASIAQDLDLDGRVDLVVPTGREVEIWLERPGDGEGTYERAARVKVDVGLASSAEVREFSAELTQSFRVPALDVQDVNGDARPDLIVHAGPRYAWHLQPPGGGFAADPDVVLDLALFRDGQAERDFAFGRTIPGGAEASLERADLDGDGIGDFVIVHGTKIWVFHGTSLGPRFDEPSLVLKTEEPVTIASVLRLDEDPRPDLLLVKVKAPSFAAVLLGFLSSWSIEVEVLGHRNEDGRRFAARPTWQRTLELQLPAVLDVLRNPESLSAPFESAEGSFRTEVRGDFDGDGRADVALASADFATLELWLAREEEAEEEELLRRELFELLFERDAHWDLAELAALVAEIGAERTARVSGGRAPDAAIELGEGSGLGVSDLLGADVDGDGREEIVVVYGASDRARAFGVLGLTRRPNR